MWRHGGMIGWPGQWTNPVEKEVWILDDFLPEDKVDELLEKLNSTSYRTIGETIKSESQLKDSKVEQDTQTVSDFSYNVHGDIKIREDFVVRDSIAEQLSKIFPKESVADYTDRDNELFPLQLFMKSHGVGRRYSLHSESFTTYGTHGFMIFLDEVEGCDLVFPSEKSLPALWEKYPLWKPMWEKNKETIPTSRYLDDFRYSPKRNQCILFKLESAHYVDEPQGEFIDKPGSWRHSIQGWPWVEPEFQKRMLNKISTYGDR